ncbi:SCO2322 family protein [Streptomyces sp. KLOTTS4A1]|uniref:SCO2322 family protein n=1 Tax=Streptomyces sp. KLOTTS4A1 TaxID=3390996 RepID=UPI0039F507CC
MRQSAAALLAGAVLAVLCAAPAQADAYRYWSFWFKDDKGAWAYATQGPATARPSDGDVEGFRFAVSEDSADASKPRSDAGFEEICADTAAKGGQKRVALVIDFGTAADAPSGETPPKPRTACARIDEDGTSAEALAAVAKPLRYDSSALLCAVSGYPQRGCGEMVSGDGAKEPTGSDAADASDAADSAAPGDDGGPSVGLLAGLAAVLLLGVAAIWQARRRRG